MQPFHCVLKREDGEIEALVFDLPRRVFFVSPSGEALVVGGLVNVRPLAPADGTVVESVS